MDASAAAAEGAAAATTGAALHTGSSVFVESTATGATLDVERSAEETSTEHLSRAAVDAAGASARSAGDDDIVASEVILPPPDEESEGRESMVVSAQEEDGIVSPQIQEPSEEGAPVLFLPPDEESGDASHFGGADDLLPPMDEGRTSPGSEEAPGWASLGEAVDGDGLSEHGAGDSAPTMSFDL